MSDYSITYADDGDGVYYPTDAQLRKRIADEYGFSENLIKLNQVSFGHVTRRYGYPTCDAWRVCFEVRGYCYSTTFDGYIMRDYEADPLKRDYGADTQEVA